VVTCLAMVAMEVPTVRQTRPIENATISPHSWSGIERPIAQPNAEPLGLEVSASLVLPSIRPLVNAPQAKALGQAP
jgi:hypothetical protein